MGGDLHGPEKKAGGASRAGTVRGTRFGRQGVSRGFVGGPGAGNSGDYASPGRISSPAGGRSAGLQIPPDEVEFGGGTSRNPGMQPGAQFQAALRKTRQGVGLGRGGCLTGGVRSVALPGGGASEQGPGNVLSGDGFARAPGRGRCPLKNLPQVGRGNCSGPRLETDRVCGNQAPQQQFHGTLQVPAAGTRAGQASLPQGQAGLANRGKILRLGFGRDWVFRRWDPISGVPSKAVDVFGAARSAALPWVKAPVPFPAGRVIVFGGHRVPGPEGLGGRP